MGETTYILIDKTEKRVYTGHHMELDRVLDSLSRNPETLEEFDTYHGQSTGKRLFDEGNRPKVPGELSVDTIRNVLGMDGIGEDEVLAHWRSCSFYQDPNYLSFGPDDKTDHDIPELTSEIEAEWKREDPDAETFPTANDYRRFSCNDGIVVADLRTRELKYISRSAFRISKDRGPSGWKLVRE